jgi:hypothetical protein
MNFNELQCELEPRVQFCKLANIIIDVVIGTIVEVDCPVLNVIQMVISDALARANGKI